MATITGTAAGETLNGTRLQDDIFGLGGDDTIRGRAGNDTIDGGTEDDLLIGRTGSDTYWVDSELDKVVERLGEGESDAVFATISFTLRRNIENLELRGEAVRGDGNDLDNRLTVEAGQDVDNVLNGRGGADFMSGGHGDDTYYVDDVNDFIEELGQGLDTVRSTVSFNVGVFDQTVIEDIYVEDLVLLGTAVIDGTGGRTDNRIVGNSADNVLMGMGGSDVLNGRGGNDSLYGGRGFDTLTGGAGEDGFYFELLGFDKKIRDFTSADDTIYLDRDAYTEIPEGVLPESAFVRGSGPFVGGSDAQDADDRIIYYTTEDHPSAFVYYDPDGTGEMEKTLLFVVPTGTEIQASDFIGY
ncbi:MAG TPA: calcium-binding protein [Allosphingosinicella sp.]|jgi:Ca2+-binding RTX toxin-like protein